MQTTTTALVSVLLTACAPATLPPPTVEPKPVAVDATKEQAEGFVALFDGKDLAGWIGDTKGYKVEDVGGGAAIVCQPGGTNLFTKDEFGDFEFRFEFQLTPGANNGIALRAPTEGDPAYAGFESQILDNTADQYKGLKEWQYHGSIYGVAAATATALRPVGEWNHETITMKGRMVKVELNGVVIVDIDLEKVAPDGKTVSDHKVEGLKRTQGHIGFCGHGDRVAYRNLRVKRL
ncbi:MAG: DUF1080 domain-containing protein [bacterium]